MTQSRKMSLAETLTSTAIGYAVATALTFTVLPLFGYHVTVSDSLGISAIFTAVSILRGYLVRRMFNMRLNVDWYKLGVWSGLMVGNALAWYGIIKLIQFIF